MTELALLETAGKELAALKKLGGEMRHAIDMLESAMMGMGDFVEMPRVFCNSPSELRIAPKMTVGEMRRVCSALSECTRIINSEEFNVFARR